MNKPAFETQIALMDGKVRLRASSAANPDQPLAFDYAPPLGTGHGFAGLELLTMTFGGCVSTTVLFLLKKSGVTVQDFAAHVQGFRRDEPLSLGAIRYQIEVACDPADEPKVAEALQKARSISPVWLSLRPDIQVETGYDIKAQL